MRYGDVARSTLATSVLGFLQSISFDGAAVLRAARSAASLAATRAQGLDMAASLLRLLSPAAATGVISTLACAAVANAVADGTARNVVPGAGAEACARLHDGWVALFSAVAAACRAARALGRPARFFDAFVCVSVTGADCGWLAETEAVGGAALVARVVALCGADAECSSALALVVRVCLVSCGDSTLSSAAMPLGGVIVDALVRFVVAAGRVGSSNDRLVSAVRALSLLHAMAPVAVTAAAVRRPAVFHSVRELIVRCVARCVLCARPD